MKNEYRQAVLIEVEKPDETNFESLQLLKTLKHKNGKSTLKHIVNEKSNKKYNIPDEEILPVHKLKKANILLPYKQFMKEQQRIRFKTSMLISIHNQYKNCRSNAQKYLALTDTPSEVHAITDLDNDYFTFVDGRPIKINTPIYKSFKVILNDLLRIREEIGYKNDCILNIDVNRKNNKHIYELTAKQITFQANYFDRYISEDYRHSMCLLAQSEQLQNTVETKVRELHNLASEMFTIMSRIVSLDYKYSQQQKYGRFLYYLSPPIWRLHNREFANSVEIEAKGFDYGDSHDEDTFVVIFEKLRHICFRKPIKPVLFFSRPGDLIKVFDVIEKQQLHYLTHVIHLNPYIENLKTNLNFLKAIITLDSASVLNSISVFEKYLNYYETRCADLQQKFYKILFGMFYDSVGTVDVLKLRLHLEFCFEKVISDKPMNMDIFSIAKHLENFYMDYSYRLDNIRSDTVRRAVAKYQETEKRKFMKAEKALKEVRLFNRLENQLLSAHGLEQSTTRKIQVISLGNKISNNTRKSMKTYSSYAKKRDILTADEVEYLILFTDWTENEDPSTYLQRLSNN